MPRKRYLYFIFTDYPTAIDSNHDAGLGILFDNYPQATDRKDELEFLNDLAREILEDLTGNEPTRGDLPPSPKLN